MVGETVACGRQYADGGHCSQVRLPAPDENSLNRGQREESRTFQASSLTARPTGAQQMCKMLSRKDSVPIRQSTRLLHAWPL